MKDIKDGVYSLDRNHDLVYSEDDEKRTGKGFYVQRYPGGECSQSFAQPFDAMDALKTNQLTFNNEEDK